MYIKSEIKRHKNETDKINGPSRSDMKPRFVALNFQNHSFHITKSTSFPGSLFSAFLGRWKKESFCKKSKGGRGERLWERGWLQNLVAICNLSTGINLAWKLPHQNGVKNWEPEICTIIIHMYSCFLVLLFWLREWTSKNVYCRELEENFAFSSRTRPIH